MISFFRSRGLELAAVIVILTVISVAQGGISYTMAYGTLRNILPRDSSLLATVLVTVRFGLMSVMVVLWALKRKQALFRLIVIANGIFTFALLTHTIALVTVLFGSASEAAHALILDVALMATSNVLIFSIWYWIIDPPGVEEIPRANDKWNFLFPQRANDLPHFELWVPRYPDYLFVAFMTSLAFSPTDTLPLTRRAKMLMLLQAFISFVTLVGIAGGAIGILTGGK